MGAEAHIWLVNLFTSHFPPYTIVMNIILKIIATGGKGLWYFHLYDFSHDVMRKEYSKKQINCKIIVTIIYY